ncbi:MAG: hypothetical protein ACYDEN_08265, partial [Acidimicrobiales bacterium]
MALASRSSRRASGRRWLAVGVVLTLLVLLVDASIKSRSPGPTRQLNGSIWIDRAFALVEQSDVQGEELASFLSDTKPTSGAAVTAQLDGVAAGARSTYLAYTRIRPPADLAGAAGLLQSCLLVRSEEARRIESAATAALAARVGTGIISRSGGAVAGAMQRLEVADQAYALFGAQLPRWLHVHAPPSRWITASMDPSPSGLTVFLTSLQSRASLRPVSSVAIEAVGTTPSAVGARGGTQILAPGHQLTVNVVVGNTGNQTERNLTVTASITPAVGTSSARVFVARLDPGTSQALTIGYLAPPLGQKVTLTVTLTPAAGDPARARTTTLLFEMPSPTTSAPTTTARSSTTPLPGPAGTSGSGRSSGAGAGAGAGGATSGTTGSGAGTTPTGTTT